MHLQSLSLQNFRNYEALDLEFSPHTNVVIGKNGQGKTNLLEAIDFLSNARSRRTGSDRELIRAQAPFASIAGLIAAHHYDGRNRIDVQFQDGSPGGRLKTVFKLNGSPVRSRSQMLGQLPSVSFFLSDLQLLRGTPEDRRRWLDTAAAQYDKRHLQLVSDYQKIRLQKNRLLKDPPDQISDAHLAAWNEQLAQAGARLTASRLAYLSIIHDLVTIQYLSLAHAQEALTFEYQSSALNTLYQAGLLAASAFPTDATLLEGVLREELQTRRAEELRRGVSLVGPHRDDIRFSLDKLDAAAYGSQGQQRSVVLALKLTELQVLTRKINDFPILLMDDVMAELDPDRQRLLMENISPQSQVFLTTTHLNHSWQSLVALHSANPDHPMAVYCVEAGQVRKLAENLQPEDLPALEILSS